MMSRWWRWFDVMIAPEATESLLSPLTKLVNNMSRLSRRNNSIVWIEKYTIHGAESIITTLGESIKDLKYSVNNNIAYLSCDSTRESSRLDCSWGHSILQYDAHEVEDLTDICLALLLVCLHSSTQCRSSKRTQISRFLHRFEVLLAEDWSYRLVRKHEKHVYIRSTFARTTNHIYNFSLGIFYHCRD